MLTQWGALISKVNIFKGCAIHNCESHGGIVVSSGVFKNHEYFKSIRTLGEDFFKDFHEGSYYFEEDCESSIILASLPKEVLINAYPHLENETNYKHFQNSNYKNLLRYFPSVFTAITGKEVGIFESAYHLEDLLLSQQNSLHYATVETGCNIPKDFLAVTLTIGLPFYSNSVTVGCYLLSADEFNQGQGQSNVNQVFMPFDETVCKNKKKFIIDKSLPRYRPNRAKADHYYFCKQHYNVNYYVIDYYNYSRKEKIKFKVEWSYWFIFVKKNPSKALEINPRTGFPYDENFKLYNEVQETV